MSFVSYINLIFMPSLRCMILASLWLSFPFYNRVPGSRVPPIPVSVSVSVPIPASGEVSGIGILGY